MIEWEGVYYHVDCSGDKWAVKNRPSPLGHPESAYRYAPNLKLSDDPDCKEDQRSVSGRLALLPKPVFNLEAIVRQVLEKVPKSPAASATDSNVPVSPDLDFKQLRSIRSLSGPLTGLTPHLMTKCVGLHVKPIVQNNGRRQAILSIGPNALTEAQIMH